MPLILNGTTGVSGVDGTAGTPAAQGSDTNTGVFYGTDTVSISTGGTARVVVNSDGQTVLGAGTAALPAVTTSGDTNTGVFFPAADTIAFAEGGVESARIDSSGNLLVGTTNSTAAGKIRATYTPTSQWGLDASESTVTIANGGNAVIPVGSGLFIITGQNATGATAVYILGGGSVALINSTDATIYISPTTTPAAGKISVAWDGANYRIYNNQGNQITFGVCSLRTRNNN